MEANRNSRPSSSSRRKVEFLACVHCNFQLVAIEHTPSGKREYTVLPGVQYSVQRALDEVTCFKCPVCGHTTIESMILTPDPNYQANPIIKMRDRAWELVKARRWSIG